MKIDVTCISFKMDPKIFMSPPPKENRQQKLFDSQMLKYV